VVTELAIAPGHQELAEAQDTIMWFETVRALAHERLEHSAEISPRLAQLIDTGMAIGADVYDRAQARAAEARAGLDAFFGLCDAVLVPAAPGEAPAGLGNTGNPIFNRMWIRSASLCGSASALGGTGLPTGVQLVGRAASSVDGCALFSSRRSPGRDEDPAGAPGPYRRRDSPHRLLRARPVPDLSRECATRRGRSRAACGDLL
jgi:hypothetical protein